MSTSASPIKPPWADYIERIMPAADPLLAEMTGRARDAGLPVVDPDVGRLLGLLVTLRRPARVVECGTCIGMSALYAARAMRDARVDGRVDTVDIDPDVQAEAAAYLRRDGLEAYVRFLPAKAADYLARQSDPIDLLFLDAVKEEYERYLELALPTMASGALVVADNLLWHGYVPGAFDPPEGWRASTAALRRFNERFVSHPRLRQASIFPMGDGTGVAVVA